MLLLAEGHTGEAWEEPFKSTGQSRSLALNATDSEGRVMQPHRYQWRTEGGVWGVKPPPKFRSFDKAAFDCKLRGKCLVFLFQQPN